MTQCEPFDPRASNLTVDRSHVRNIVRYEFLHRFLHGPHQRCVQDGYYLRIYASPFAPALLKQRCFYRRSISVLQCCRMIMKSLHIPPTWLSLSLSYTHFYPVSLPEVSSSWQEIQWSVRSRNRGIPIFWRFPCEVLDWKTSSAPYWAHVLGCDEGYACTIVGWAPIIKLWLL